MLKDSLANTCEDIFTLGCPCSVVVGLLLALEEEDEDDDGASPNLSLKVHLAFHLRGSAHDKAT
jgi:hypothetical protein